MMSGGNIANQRSEEEEKRYGSYCRPGAAAEGVWVGEDGESGGGGRRFAF